MIRVVLVDDHLVLRQGLRRVIEAHGDITVVGEASGGKEALSVVAGCKVDVVVMDITMPDGDGFEAVRLLRKKRKKSLRFVMLSMHNDEAHVHRALECGAHAYVDKGSGIDELADAIRAVHRGENFLSSRIVPTDRAKAAALKSLTHREFQVLIGLASGYTNHEVAAQLDINVKTVDTHRGHLLRKLYLRNNSDLTRFAIQSGLVVVET